MPHVAWGIIVARHDEATLAGQALPGLASVNNDPDDKDANAALIFGR